MKKLLSALTLIFTLTLFTGSAFAQEACAIKWWTTNAGSVEVCTEVCAYSCCGWVTYYYRLSGKTPTTETSRTQAAALEAYQAIMGEDPDSFEGDCYSGSSGNYDLDLCLAGTWDSAEGTYVGPVDSSGGWDVISFIYYDL